MQFLLDNSILLIFLVTTAILGYSEYRRYLQKTGLDSKEFRLLMEEKLKELARQLLAKLATTLVVSVIISAVSFREFFLPDVFHTVFITQLLIPVVYGKLKGLFE